MATVLPSVPARSGTHGQAWDWILGWAPGKLARAPSYFATRHAGKGGQERSEQAGKHVEEMIQSRAHLAAQSWVGTGCMDFHSNF